MKRGVFTEWLGNLAALLASLVFIGLAAEAYVRFHVDDGMQFDIEMWKYATRIKRPSADLLIGHEHQPNQRARLMGVDFETNAKGLRDRDFAYDKDPSQLRILMLGDSLTVGWGVAATEVFSKRLERLYADAGKPVEIINTGVGNYNTVQEVEFFLTEGYKYNPDVVVLNYFVNDAEPVPASRPPGFLQKNCMSCAYFLGRIDTFLRSLSPAKEWTSYYLGLYGHGSGPGWLASKASIEKLANFCKAKGIALVVVNLPEMHDVGNYKFSEITSLVEQAAKENGAPFIDILPYLKNETSSKLWVTVPDPHPNGYANGFIAEGLFRGLQEIDLKPKSP